MPRSVSINLVYTSPRSDALFVSVCRILQKYTCGRLTIKANKSVTMTFSRKRKPPPSQITIGRNRMPRELVLTLARGTLDKRSQKPLIQYREELESYTHLATPYLRCSLKDPKYQKLLCQAASFFISLTSIERMIMMKIKLNDDTFTISLLFFLHLSVSYNINYDHNKIIIIIVIANLKKMNNVYKKHFFTLTS